MPCCCRIENTPSAKCVRYDTCAVGLTPCQVACKTRTPLRPPVVQHIDQRDEAAHLAVAGRPQDRESARPHNLIAPHKLFG